MDLISCSTSLRLQRHLKWSCRITVIKLRGGPSSSFCFQGSPLPWIYHDTFGDKGLYTSACDEHLGKFSQFVKKGGLNVHLWKHH